MNYLFEAEIEGMTAKIFGLGLSKTGTTSVAAALRILGYRAAHFMEHWQNREGIARWQLGDFETDILKEYDAAMDLPVPLYFSQLDKRYPDSKFILTVRQPDDWVKSLGKQWVRNPLQNNMFGLFRATLRLAAYGFHNYSPICDSRLLRVYETHQQNVLDYFKDRPEDLLVMDVINGDGWEKLCDFLGKPVPDTEFPWKNKSSDFENA